MTALFVAWYNLCRKNQALLVQLQKDGRTNEASRLLTTKHDHKFDAMARDEMSPEAFANSFTTKAIDRSWTDVVLGRGYFEWGFTAYYVQRGRVSYFSFDSDDE